MANEEIEYYNIDSVRNGYYDSEGFYGASLEKTKILRTNSFNGYAIVPIESMNKSKILFPVIDQEYNLDIAHDESSNDNNSDDNNTDVNGLSLKVFWIKANDLKALAKKWDNIDNDNLGTLYSDCITKLINRSSADSYIKSEINSSKYRYSGLNTVLPKLTSIEGDFFKTENVIPKYDDSLNDITNKQNKEKASLYYPIKYRLMEFLNELDLNNIDNYGNLSISSYNVKTDLYDYDSANTTLIDNLSDINIKYEEKIIHGNNKAVYFTLNDESTEKINTDIYYIWYRGKSIYDMHPFYASGDSTNTNIKIEAADKLADALKYGVSINEENSISIDTNLVQDEIFECRAYSGDEYLGSSFYKI